MHVDKTRNYDVVRGVEYAINTGRGRHAASDNLDDAGVIYDNTAPGVFRKDCDRVLDARSHQRTTRQISCAAASGG
jgi:hypothetical protein